MAQRLAGALRLGVAPRLANQRPKLLAVGCRILGQPLAKRRLVGDQAITPLFGQVQRRAVPARTAVLLTDRSAYRIECRDLELAHQFADELQLPPLALEIGNFLGVRDRIAKLVGQIECCKRVGTQVQQVFAEFLQLRAFALLFGATGFVVTFEFALEFQVQFAALRDELPGDEIAFSRFAWHGSGGLPLLHAPTKRRAQAAKYHSCRLDALKK